MTPQELINNFDFYLSDMNKEQTAEVFELLRLGRPAAFEESTFGSRPIKDTADAVCETALTAKAMLDNFRSSWLWRLLTIKPKD
jgi:hypothetical protein